MDAQKGFIHIVVKLANISLTVFILSWCPDMTLKTKVCFYSYKFSPLPNFCTQTTKIITSMCPMTLQDSSNHFYPPNRACPTMTFCPTMTLLSSLYVFTPLDFVQSSSYFPNFMKSKSDSLLHSFFEKYWSVKSVSQWNKVNIPWLYILKTGKKRSEG